MTSALYLAASEPHSGKSAVAVGLLGELCARGGRVGIFRPVVSDLDHDPLTEILLGVATSPLGAREAVGVTYDQAHDNPEAATEEIVDRFHRYAAEHDVVLVVGSDYSGVAAPTEFSENAAIAAHLGAPMVLIIPAHDRTPAQVVGAARATRAEARARHATVAAVIANRINPDQRDAVDALLADRIPSAVTYALAADEVLSAPTVRDLMEACGGRLLRGEESMLDREAMGIIVGAMTMPNVLDRLRESRVLICPGDREDVLLGALLAHASSTFPSLSGIILNGGFTPSPQVQRLIEGLNVELPIISSPEGTMRTAMTLHDVPGRVRLDLPRKIERSRALVHGTIDVGALLPQADLDRPSVVTPLIFEHQLTARSRASGAHIVLPEGVEDRILRAADTVLARRMARLTILGEEDPIRQRASALGLQLDQAQIIDPRTSELREQFADDYAQLRAHKGVNRDMAYDLVVEPSYFGTLMVRAGQADGMVSGSITTTAATVRPALEVIRTAPGIAVVSSVFFMCLPDRVLVYGDCAINPDPNAAQLADIAISSARTAQQFGVEPLVAMLSYSTGGSGSGADVDKVREATALVRERAPELEVEGPIQYDAAIDPAVAATKLKGSTVAGKATVFIFPDLNTGNNTYKAVQRSASAVAIGPVLQGLNAPVNDLSRGASVKDIINTIAITAIQASGGNS